MPLVPGLSANIREEAAPAAPLPEAVDIQVEDADEGEDVPEMDDKGNILRIDHPDGSITVSLNGNPVADAEDDENPPGWFDNLVDKIDDLELSRISDDLMRGISDDQQSRQDWVEDRATGLRLLGLKIEIPGLQGAADGAPVEGMSRVRHPLLLEAVLRFQANARSELLPTDGPVKVRNDSNNANLEQDRLANALEKDLNHYLTAVATEYYPDTDRMLLMLGFGGTAFKKITFCPLRNRPVSETVDAEDLIVNNAATDLSNAKRITHRVYMRPSVVRRMQILGVYKDIDLHTPNMAQLDSVQLEKRSQEGIAVSVTNPDDRDREIYECYCELDIQGFHHKFKGKVTGLEIPYRVTIDASSKKILSIVRNYDEDGELPEARQNFVKYTFVPGFGFYDIGLLHILGNTVNAITAAWRELLDAGMYANFPGFLMAETGARQNTNIFRVPPGGGALVKTGGLPISQAVMPLPYKEPSQALMALTESMAQTGMRIGGTSEQAVGEGRADAPVGTTLAMIEQAQKVMNSVHKRMHAAQATEFQLLARCFKENPESFWQKKNKPSYAWDEQTFLAALNDCELVPQADPNTASHTQRIMKIMALKQLQAAQPGLYDPIAIDKAALKAIGWNNPEQFMAPPSAQGKMPPEIQEKIANYQLKQKEVGIKEMEAQARTQKLQADTALDQAKLQFDMQSLSAGGLVEGSKGMSPEELELKKAELQQKADNTQYNMMNSAADARNQEEDRKAKMQIEAMKLEGQQARESQQRSHEFDMKRHDAALEQAKMVLAQIAKGGR
jgi:hypothetical protein